MEKISHLHSLRQKKKSQASKTIHPANEIVSGVCKTVFAHSYTCSFVYSTNVEHLLYARH